MKIVVRSSPCANPVKLQALKWQFSLWEAEFPTKICGELSKSELGEHDIFTFKLFLVSLLFCQHALSLLLPPSLEEGKKKEPLNSF